MNNMGVKGIILTWNEEAEEKISGKVVFFSFVEMAAGQCVISIFGKEPISIKCE
jgi:hypothetical protein